MSIAAIFGLFILPSALILLSLAFYLFCKEEGE